MLLTRTGAAHTLLHHNCSPAVYCICANVCMLLCHAACLPPDSAHMAYRTAQAFSCRLGVLGMNIQAERMLQAFVCRGLELKLHEIKYHAQGKANEVEKLTGIVSKDSDAEVRHAKQLMHVRLSGLSFSSLHL